MFGFIKCKEVKYKTLDEMVREGKVLSDLTIDNLIYLRDNIHITSFMFLHVMDEFSKRATIKDKKEDSDKQKVLADTKEIEE
jgi:hypothetical protein